MLAAIASLTALGLTLGWLLGLAARYLKVEGNPVVEKIEGLLPGSQCGQCGYPGCGPAADAVASGQAPVSMCPPGGRALAEELAALLGVSVDLSGVEDKASTVAYIHENLCVGCTKCFKRCPTDAILGGPKMMHAVFADACTGCEMCFDVCPTECIEMRPVEATLQTWYWPKPAQAA
ncbi:MAG: electron transport complex subunit RsxB [Thiohalocapsa sp.]